MAIFYRSSKGNVNIKCIKYRGNVGDFLSFNEYRIYLSVDGLYPERELLAYLYDSLSEEQKEELGYLLDGKLEYFLKALKKNMGAMFPLPPISSYILIRMLEKLSKGKSITLYANIGFSPFYYLIADMFRSAVTIEAFLNISLVLLAAYDIPICTCDSIQKLRASKHHIDLEYFVYFLAGDIWKKFLFSEKDTHVDIIRVGEVLYKKGILGKHSLVDTYIVNAMVNSIDIKEIDSQLNKFLSSNLAPLPMLYDTASWVSSYFDMKKAIFYKKLALLSYRNKGDYALALARGMEIKGKSGLTTQNALDMEIIKLANVSDYYPDEVRHNFHISYLSKPFTIFHVYLWGIRNLKNVSYIPPMAYGLIGKVPKTAEIYLFTILLKNRYLKTTKYTLSDGFFLDIRNQVIQLMENVGRLQKDVVLQSQIAAATSFADEYPDASVSILRKVVSLGNQWKLSSLVALALNNMATVMMNMDVSHAMVKGLYEEALATMFSAGGGTMLLPIILNNYTVHVMSSKPLSVIEEYNRFTSMLFPHREFFGKVISLFIKLVTGETIKENIADILSEVRNSSSINKRRFTEFVLYQIVSITKEKEILNLLTMSNSRFFRFVLQAAMGQYIGKEDEDIEPNLRYRLLFLYALSTNDINKAILFGRKLATLYLKNGDIFYYGVVHEWLAQLYEKVDTQKSMFSYMMALYIYHNLGYQAKASNIIFKLGINLRTWYKYIYILIAPVMEELLRRNILRTMYMTLSTETSLEDLMKAILWNMANFIPFWQGYVMLSRYGEVIDFYSTDMSGRKNITLDEFMFCNTHKENITVASGCMEGVYVLEKDLYITVHIETVLGKELFNKYHITLFKEFFEFLLTLIPSVMIKERGLVDSLTGLYARWYTMRRIEELLSSIRRNDESLAILFIDVDNFKDVNDIYGHRIGDIVLKKVAGAIKTSLRSIDIVGRYGGDEFVVVMPRASLDNAVAVAKRIIMRVKQDMASLEESNNVSISVGIADTTVCNNCTADKLILLADKAMYVAKRHGKGRIFIYKGED